MRYRIRNAGSGFKVTVEDGEAILAEKSVSDMDKAIEAREDARRNGPDALKAKPKPKPDPKGKSDG